MPSARGRQSHTLAVAQAGAAGALLWACVVAFPALAPPWLPTIAHMGAGAAAAWAAWAALRRPARPTLEDLACGFWVSGLPGSGKTGYLIHRLRERMLLGEGGLWLSTKGGCELLAYIPAEVAPCVDWLSPANDRPRGINLLQLHSTDPREVEREGELLAGYAAALIERLHPSASQNMIELARMAALALLSYSHAARQPVSLVHLYLFFRSSEYRRRVLTRCVNPALRHAWADDELEGRTVSAVLRQLRRTVTSANLLCALGQPVGVDLRQAMAANRWVITDANEGVLGPEGADLCNQVVMSVAEMLCPARPPRSRLFTVAADEVQRYQTRSCQRAIEISRAYGVSWWLSCQSAGQLSDSALLAAKMTGSHIYLRQHPDDNAQAQKATGFAGEREIDFGDLQKRHYVARFRVRGRPVTVRAITPDLPAPSGEVEAEIRRANSQGPDREATLAPIYRLLDLDEGAAISVRERGPIPWE